MGSAINVSYRWKGHLRQLNGNKHHSQKLQRHFNKYGIEDLTFKLITSCDRDDLLKIEQFYIDSFVPYFNECPIAGSRLGKKCSSETLERISKSQKGRVPWNKGKKATAEARKNQSEAHKGKAVWNKGLTKDDERVMKYVSSNVGRKISDETRKRLSESHKGHIPWNKKNRAA